MNRQKMIEAAEEAVLLDADLIPDIKQELIDVLQMAKNNLQIFSGVSRPNQKAYKGDYLLNRINEVLIKSTN